MKLHSDYLNPFQPFPERELDNQGEERPRSAIEDNLSRSVFSALANAEQPFVLAMFLQALAPHGSPALCARTEALAETLRHTEPSKVEYGLQTWPAAAMRELESPQVLLIGISSSHGSTWTHNQRLATEDPRPDAWIYVPRQMLLVFECKNDEHPLDATQVSDYAHSLKLLTKKDNVPRAKQARPSRLKRLRTFRRHCADLVLDAPWSAVVDALQQIHQLEECVGGLGRWLCGQAAAYVQWHIRPPYRGIPTILEWLKGPDTPDRCNHLRTFVRRMGDELARSAQGRQGAITFAQDNNGAWDLARGAGSAVYVKLQRDGELLQRDWLGRKADAVLWFQFAKHENQRIGLEYYIQASGSHTNGKGEPKAAWNKASARHLACAEPFEVAVAAWVRQAPPSSQMIVSAVRFNKKQIMWRGGGVVDPTAPNSSQTTPQGALAFLQKNQKELWRFPRVGLGEEARTVEEAAPQVRKPALSLLTLLDTSTLISCGKDGLALQDFLQIAVASITTKTGHEPRWTEGEHVEQQKGTSLTS